MDGESSDAFFVVCQDAHRFSGCEIPEAYGRVERGGDHLRVRLLAFYVCDGAGVAGEDYDVGASAHVPDSSDAVAAAGNKDIECGVESQSVNA